MSASASKSGPTRWIVGLDLRERSDGALRFAAWMAQHGGDRVVGLHVLEEDELRAALRYHHLDEVHAAARAAAEAAVEAAGVRSSIASVEVLEGKNAEDTLIAARTYHHCDGIVIGRNAPRDGIHAVRLGRVARRVLRALPSPVAVVPPDLGGSIGAGPVLLACSLGDDSSNAAEFARDFAARFGRTVELVHVASVPTSHASQYLPRETVTKIRNDLTASATAQLERWATAHDLAGAVRTVRLGGVVESMVELSRERDAVAIVIGSRRLSTFERWLITSAGSDLASHASCPVIVVPPA